MPLSTSWVDNTGQQVNAAFLNSLDTAVNALVASFSVASGKVLTVSNSLTLAGTDATTMTFPATSATIARTDAANTFTGVQTMTSPSLTTPVLGTPTSGTLTNCTGYQPSNLSTALPNTFNNQGILNANYAAQSQTCVSTTKYYVTNSGLYLPATPKAGMSAGSSVSSPGTIFRWRVVMSKTAAGSTGSFNIVIFRGTNGTNADTADVNQAIGSASTAVVDTLFLDVQAVVTVTGATGSYFWSITATNTAGASAGFGLVPSTASSWSGTVSSVALNTASLIFGLGFVSTTATPVITVPVVEAQAYNMS